MHRRMLLPPLAVFTLLSGADLYLTWRLLTPGLPSVREANPVAAWVLASGGWAGLTTFKAAAALSVVAATSAIAGRRPRVALGLVGFGCVAVAAVVGYSAQFRAVHRALGNGVLDEETAQVRRAAWLDGGADETARLRAFKGQLTGEMIAGRLGFRAAVERLAASEFAGASRRLERLRLLYRLDADRDCWAANLLVYALDAVRNDPARWQQWAPVWLSEYCAHFRASTPTPLEWGHRRDWPALPADTGTRPERLAEPVPPPGAPAAAG